MKSWNRVRAVAVMGVILIVASALSQRIKLQNEKFTLESRVAALEGRVASLENEITNVKKWMIHPPVRIIPCK
jgi:hypothetical protein